MSAELFGGLYKGTEALRSRGSIVHSAIHDLESFFWVLLYLCLTRDGPGGGRRNELSVNEPSTAETKPIYAAVHCLFDSENVSILLHNKQLLFSHPEDLDNIVFPCIYPYFESLKPLLCQWWKTLRFAYTTYDDYAAGSIHDRIIKLLEDELSTISTRDLHANLAAEEVARMKDKTDKEIRRRKDELEFIRTRTRELQTSLEKRLPSAGQ